MRRHFVKLAVALALAVGASGASSAVATTATSGVGPAFQYMGPLTFGPDGVLFAADAQDVSVFALQLGAVAERGAPGTRRVDGIDNKIAALLGTDAASIQITDLAVHPKTRNAFISVVRGQAPRSTSVLVKVDGAGALEVVGLDAVKYSKIKLPNPPGEITPLPLAGGREFAVPNYPGSKPPHPAFGIQTITDIQFSQGRLWIAGLSNEDFASKMRSVAYPFLTADSGVSIEIYHASHGQMETRSPVYSFLPQQIDGEDFIVAGYLCTPLVTIPMKSLMKEGQKVVGKTIAEFGNQNRPLDMISYRKDGRDFILMSNTARGVMKFATDTFASAPAISERVPGTGGVPFETIESITGVEQLDRLDEANALVIARSASKTLDLQPVALP